MRTNLRFNAYKFLPPSHSPIFLFNVDLAGAEVEVRDLRIHLFFLFNVRAHIAPWS